VCFFAWHGNKQVAWAKIVGVHADTSQNGILRGAF
jgi:hypothetical protein